MEMEQNVSVTLKLAHDDMKQRLTQLGQDVSTYDHLIFVVRDFRSSSSDYTNLKQHFDKITNIQDRIREDISQLGALLKTFYNERAISENKAWIVGKSKTIRDEFIETLDRLRLIQQNFMQSNKSRIFDFERELATNPQLREQIELYRFSVNHLETDLYNNEDFRADLVAMVQAENYQTIELESRTRVQAPSYQEFQQHSTLRLEELIRKQYLMLVVIVVVSVTMFSTVLLIRNGQS